jgi:hypothetical protein
MREGTGFGILVAPLQFGTPLGRIDDFLKGAAGAGPAVQEGGRGEFLSGWTALKTASGLTRSLGAHGRPFR